MSPTTARRGSLLLCLTVALAACGESGGGGGNGSTGGSGAGGSGPGFFDAGPGGGGGGSAGGGAGGGFNPDAPCEEDGECPEGYYCERDEDSFEGGRCEVGCRIDPDSCVDGYLCDAETRECKRDERCEVDDDCYPTEYCKDGMCAEGCRVDPDTCYEDEQGRRQGCNSDTRQCEVLIACCSPDETCDMVLPGACEDPAPAETCFPRNPCAGRCTRDRDCENNEYCRIPDGADEGHCEIGCRPNVPNSCPPPRVCDAETRECVEVPCPGGDADCPLLQFCNDDGFCQVGCRLDDPESCPAGETCLENRQCGSGCVTDDDCVRRNGEAWYCRAGECQPPCDGHDACPAGEACDPERRRCAEGCREDAREDNDSADDATALEFEEVDGAQVFDSGDESLYVCPGDRDWFEFSTPDAGWTVDVRVEFVHAEGDIDVRLHDPAGNVVAVGDSLDDNEELVFPDPELEGPVAPAGTWKIEVYGRGVAANDYRLRVALRDGSGCIADEGERDAGDGDALRATRIDLPQMQQEQVIRNRTICPGDEDWYVVRMGQLDGLQVRLNILGNGTEEDEELTFEIFGPGLPDADDEPVFVPNQVAEGEGGTRVLVFDAPRNNPQILDGPYYIRVRGFNAGQFSQYDLAVAVDRSRPLCAEDVAEPNEVRAQAHDLLTVEGFVRDRIDGGGIELIPGRDLVLEGLWLCSGEEDWFRLEVEEGDALDVAIHRREEMIAGDTIIELLDVNGRRVGAPGRNEQPVNSARADNLPAGVYHIRVVGVADTQSHYDLRVNRTTAPDRCRPDRFDAEAPNDAREDATPIEPGEYANLVLCGVDGDGDWYVFETDEVANVTVSIAFAHAQGDLELDVYRADRGIAMNAGDTQGHSNDDNETVVLRNLPADRYFVHVRGLNDPNVRYDLQLQVTPRVFVCEPPADDSRDFDTAVPLGAGPNDVPGEFLCDQVPRDEDFFQIEVPAGATRTIAATFVYGDDGDLYLSLYDDDRMAVIIDPEANREATTREVARGNSKQCIIIEPVADGDRVFYIQVVPLSVNNVIEEDGQLAYQLFIRDGDVCDDIPPPAPGVAWPRVPGD